MIVASAAQQHSPTLRDFRRRRDLWFATALLLAGLLLRLFFLRRHAFLAGDSYLYQDIAQNWLHEHVYGLSTDAAPRPTLIRLPGYPAILAALAWAFDRFLNADPGSLRSFLPVLWPQVFVDLLTCVIASYLARRLFGRRAAVASLALACLCPFTANYTAVPLTETFTLFFLMLTFVALRSWLDQPRSGTLIWLALAVSCGILLRPDQGLLVLIVLPVLFFRSGVTTMREHLVPTALCAILVALPFLPWTVRNYRTFHVVQPLAPRLANDPGEVPPRGFQAWYRTWAVDFSSTEDAYWKYPEEPVLMADLPERAFDSPAERAEVTALLQQTADTHQLSAAVEQQFALLAQQRTRAHWLRTYLLLPLARLANMLLHPRTEMLPVAERWWQYHLHPRQTIFAWAYGAWSFGYFALGAAGFMRLFRTATWQRTTRTVLLSMLAYIGLRCLLLMTLDNAEQRYTLEFFPLLFVFASALWPNPQEQTA